MIYLGLQFARISLESRLYDTINQPLHEPRDVIPACFRSQPVPKPFLQLESPEVRQLFCCMPSDESMFSIVIQLVTNLINYSGTLVCVGVSFKQALDMQIFCSARLQTTRAERLIISRWKFDFLCFKFMSNMKPQILLPGAQSIV